jgi:hypothetical protein
MRPQRGGLGESITGNPLYIISTMIFGTYFTIGLLLVLFVGTFVAIYFYYKTYGYTIQTGIDKLMNAFKNKEQIDVSLTQDGKPEASVSLVPPPPESTSGAESKQIKALLGMSPDKPGQTHGSQSTGFSGPGSPAPAEGTGIIATVTNTMNDPGSVPGSANSGLPFSPEERPSGMPGARETPGFTKRALDSLTKAFGPDMQVFNVSRNVYTYDEAAPLCKAMGAELASYEQVGIAAQHGADWCNYGWVKGQMAVFPTSEETWNKLQTGPAAYRHSCGKPGVNGGYFDNPELRFGVNCFGPRPQKKDKDELLMDSEGGMPPTAEQIEFDKKVHKFRDQMANISVLPWSREKWQG